MKICSVCNKENNNEGKFCVFCGGTLVEQSRRTLERNRNIESTNTKLKITIVILTIILVLVGVAAIYFGVVRENENEETISYLRDELDKSEDNNKILKSENLEQLRKISFFDDNVVFVLEGYGRYYYTYDQVQQVTQGKKYYFSVYSVQDAINDGYRAWK